MVRVNLNTRLDKTACRRLKQLSALCAQLRLSPYLVGGIVRDLLLSKPVREDMDVTVCGGKVHPLAEKLSGKWRAKFRSHEEFLTFRIDFKDGAHLDLVTARQETYSRPGSLPTVRPGSLETDIFRRDFRLNAVACSLSAKNWGECIDLAHGIPDLKKKRVSVLHENSFRDDPTRIFRAARFAARLNFSVERATERLILRSVKEGDLQTISKDRIRAELEKILLEKNAEKPLHLLHRWGALKAIHPDLPAPSIHLKQSVAAEKESAIAVRMALWLASVPSETPEIAGLLNFPRDQQEKIRETVSLHRSLAKDGPVTDLPQKEPSQETALFFAILTIGAQNPYLTHRWKAYQRWLHSRPILDGEALKELGLKPGPQYKEIFRKIALARYEGKIRTLADESLFIQSIR